MWIPQRRWSSSTAGVERGSCLAPFETLRFRRTTSNFHPSTGNGQTAGPRSNVSEALSDGTSSCAPRSDPRSCMQTDSVTRVASLLRKPPRVICQRLLTELNAQTDRFRAPRRARAFDIQALLELTESPSLQELWARLSDSSFAIPVQQIAERDYQVACPGDGARIAAAAECALAHRVDLLGSGPIDLGSPIDWHRDFKTGHRWTPAFARGIDYTNLDRPSDVKVPWELSRLQWLMPAGQAYLLSDDERYAVAVRAVLED